MGSSGHRQTLSLDLAQLHNNNALQQLASPVDLHHFSGGVPLALPSGNPAPTSTGSNGPSAPSVASTVSASGTSQASSTITAPPLTTPALDLSHSGASSAASSRRPSMGAKERGDRSKAALPKPRSMSARLPTDARSSAAHAAAAYAGYPSNSVATPPVFTPSEMPNDLSEFPGFAQAVAAMNRVSAPTQQSNHAPGPRAPATRPPSGPGSNPGNDEVLASPFGSGQQQQSQRPPHPLSQESHESRLSSNFNFDFPLSMTNFSPQQPLGTPAHGPKQALPNNGPVSNPSLGSSSYSFLMPHSQPNSADHSEHTSSSVAPRRMVGTNAAPSDAHALSGPRPDQDIMHQIGTLMDSLVNLAASARAHFAKQEHSESSICLSEIKKTLGQIHEWGAKARDAPADASSHSGSILAAPPGFSGVPTPASLTSASGTTPIGTTDTPLESPGVAKKRAGEEERDTRSHAPLKSLRTGHGRSASQSRAPSVSRTTEPVPPLPSAPAPPAQAPPQGPIVPSGQPPESKPSGEIPQSLPAPQSLQQPTPQPQPQQAVPQPRQPPQQPDVPMSFPSGPEAHQLHGLMMGIEVHPDVVSAPAPAAPTPGSQHQQDQDTEMAMQPSVHGIQPPGSTSQPHQPPASEGVHQDLAIQQQQQPAPQQSQQQPQDGTRDLSAHTPDDGSQLLSQSGDSSTERGWNSFAALSDIESGDEDDPFDPDWDEHLKMTIGQGGSFPFFSGPQASGQPHDQAQQQPGQGQELQGAQPTGLQMPPGMDPVTFARFAQGLMGVPPGPNSGDSSMSLAQMGGAPMRAGLGGEQGQPKPVTPGQATGHSRTVSDPFMLSESTLRLTLQTPATEGEASPEAAAQAISPELRHQLDQILLRYLNDICSNLDAKDHRGEPVHQLLMPKRMARLDESPDFRPFRFRIQAFTNAFQERVYHSGLTESHVGLKKLKLYLWSQPLIARFNEDGRKAKSRGNHNWIIDARKRPEGGWEFREFTRRIAGAPTRAFINIPWKWKLRIWDPLVPSTAIRAIFSAKELPKWMQWEDEERKDTLQGTPTSIEDSGQVTVVAHYVQNGEVKELEHSLFLDVMHVEMMDTSNQQNTNVATVSQPETNGRIRAPAPIGDSDSIMSEAHSMGTAPQHGLGHLKNSASVSSLPPAQLMQPGPGVPFPPMPTAPPSMPNQAMVNAQHHAPGQPAFNHVPNMFAPGQPGPPNQEPNKPVQPPLPHVQSTSPGVIATAPQPQAVQNQGQGGIPPGVPMDTEAAAFHALHMRMAIEMRQQNHANSLSLSLPPGKAQAYNGASRHGGAGGAPPAMHMPPVQQPGPGPKAAEAVPPPLTAPAGPAPPSMRPNLVPSLPGDNSTPASVLPSQLTSPVAMAHSPHRLNLGHLGIPQPSAPASAQIPGNFAPDLPEGSLGSAPSSSATPQAAPHGSAPTVTHVHPSSHTVHHSISLASTTPLSLSTTPLDLSGMGHATSTSGDVPALGFDPSLMDAMHNSELFSPSTAPGPGSSAGPTPGTGPGEASHHM